MSAVAVSDDEPSAPRAASTPVIGTADTDTDITTVGLPPHNRVGTPSSQ